MGKIVDQELGNVFPIPETSFHLREIASDDAPAFQRIYEALKKSGHYYAYLWNFEKGEDGCDDAMQVGRRFVARALASKNETPPPAYRFAICDAASHIAGYAVLLPERRNSEIKDCEIGYFIAPEYQGQNLAMSAIAVLLEEALRVWPLESFNGKAHPDNQASLRIFQKLGMHFSKRTTSDEDFRAPERLLFIRKVDGPGSF